MDTTKSKSLGHSCDMSPTAVERRLEIVDELRELAMQLSQAKRLGPVEKRQAISESLLPFSSSRSPEKK